MTLPSQKKKKPSPPQNPLSSVRKYVAAASAPATQRAYSSDWRQFVSWCAERQLEALPATPVLVAEYVADQADAGKEVSTLERALVAISKAHQLANAKEDPAKHLVVKETMKGIRRHFSSTQKKAQPLLFEALRTVVAHLEERRVKDVRDKAGAIGSADALTGWLSDLFVPNEARFPGRLPSQAETDLKWADRNWDLGCHSE